MMNVPFSTPPLFNPLSPSLLGLALPDLGQGLVPEVGAIDLVAGDQDCVVSLPERRKLQGAAAGGRVTPGGVLHPSKGLPGVRRIPGVRDFRGDLGQSFLPLA